MSRQGVDSKFDRARRNVDEVSAGIAEFFEANPYRLETNETSDGDLVYRVRVTAEPPIEWALIIGDAVHNARSALDHLAYALVERDGGMPGDHTCFPIANGPTGYGDKLRKALAGADRSTREAVRDLRPWKGGDDALWRLHRLDIVDKHRLRVGVAAAQRGIVLGGNISGFSDWGTVQLPQIELREKNESGIPDPLRDGDEVYRVIKAARQANTSPFKMETAVTFEAIFGDGEAVTGEPIRPTLRDLVEHAASVVEPLVASL